MSFRKNPAQQMSLFDTTYNLTEREKKALLTMPVKRTDHKGRRLREGESQRKNLLYQFRYTDENGNRVVSRTPTETKTYRFNEGRHASASLPHAFYSNPYTGPIKKAQKSPIAVLTSFFQYIIIKVSSYNRDFLLDRRYTFPADPAHH